MSNLLLRIMTMKSIIGFGYYPELTVLELINMQKHSELIKMYYMLEKIDFDDDVKNILRITKERTICKPGKDYIMYGQNIIKMIDEIQYMEMSFDKDNPARWNLLNEKKRASKHYVISNCIRQNREKSKIHNRNRNQGKYY